MDVRVIDVHRKCMKLVVKKDMANEPVLWIFVKNEKGLVLAELLHTDKRCLGQILCAKKGVTYHMYVRQVS